MEKGNEGYCDCEVPTKLKAMISHPLVQWYLGPCSSSSREIYSWLHKDFTSLRWALMVKLISPRITHSHFISLISRMFSSMVILQRRGIWSNFLDLLLIRVFRTCLSYPEITVWSQIPKAWFVQQFGMTRNEAYPLVFYHHAATGCIYLIVYSDNIVITSIDHHGIAQVAQSKNGIVTSQRNYAMDYLKETRSMGAKLVDTPVDPNGKLLPSQGKPLSNPERYKRQVGKLNYLIVTHPNIFVVSVVTWFLNSPYEGHWEAELQQKVSHMKIEDKGHPWVMGYSDANWESYPTDTRSTSSYCIFIELKFGEISQTIICDNQMALHIASNPIFHERTKHTKIAFH
ncbi:hypothetical protein CR513_42510, partial [Mucuna pruriens]